MPLYGYRIVEDGLTRSVAKYRNYMVGDAQVAVHCHEVFEEHGVNPAATAKVVMIYVMRIFCFLNEMSLDSRLSRKEKKALMDLARDGIGRLARRVDGRYRIVPPIHYVPYVAACARSLWFLAFWNQVKRVIRQVIGLRRR
jgi:hypothetical protein